MSKRTGRPTAKAKTRRRPLYLTWLRPRCPNCGDARLATYSNRTDEWGATRYTICQGCGRHVVVTVE